MHDSSGVIAHTNETFMTIKIAYSSSTFILALASVLTLGSLAGCNGEEDRKKNDPKAEPAPKYSAEIRRTAYGVPHIKAKDEGSLGYGVAYAYAQDNVCLLADEIVTVNGERSKYFGPEALRTASELPNLQTDFFYRIINDDAAVSAAWDKTPALMKQLAEGYVAGYNDYLDKTGAANLPAACKNAPWVRKLTEKDFVKVLRRYAVEGSSAQFVPSIVGASPPVAGAPAPAAAKAPASHPMQPKYWTRLRDRSGSNAVALGKDASDNGQGMLLGNPHLPWHGVMRFYQLHLTIPGKMDAMGASLGGLPIVNIGFNKDLAWTHTVNSSAHFTVHALMLDPADPTKYMVDGQRQSMTRKTISVDVLGADGKVVAITRDFYSSQFGMIMVIPGMLDWNAGMAYALNDANLGNHRMLEQWSAMSSARDMDEFKASIDRVVGLPWVNTIAADKHGNTLYMDVTVVPNVSRAQQDACVPPPFKPLAAQGLFVMAGTTMACMPAIDAAAPQPGIFAGAKLPRLTRNDYVQNSNDSAWLSNPAAPLTGFPDIVSIDNSEQMARTRLGITQLRARLEGKDGMAGKLMTVPQLQGLVMSNRVYYAQIIKDDLLRFCASEKVTGCAALESWDFTANLDANVGLPYFMGMFDRVVHIPGLWAVPFNPADPVNTPRGLNLQDASVVAALRDALAASVQATGALGVPPSARWGEIQGSMGPKPIAIHGAPGEYGVYNAMNSIPVGPGKRGVVYGSSYMQIVAFDKNGPQVQALLAYSQSTDPASPHFADQTELFSKKLWVTQSFTDLQIEADPAYKTSRVTRQQSGK